MSFKVTRIALCQSAIQFENKQRNLEKLPEMLNQVAEKQAKLFLLPEMSFTGFSMRTDVTAEQDDSLLETMRDYGKKFRLWIGYGWVKGTQAELAENHYTIVDGEGHVVSDYVKIHPFSYAGEDRKFAGGDHLSFFTLDDFVVSSFICYDLRFPEIFRIASAKSSLMIVAANWPAVRQRQWETLLKSRAIENQCYVAGVNCTGTQKHTVYSGGSAVISPVGEYVGISRSDENILFCDLVNDTEMYRSKFTALKDCRPALYRDLASIWSKV